MGQLPTTGNGTTSDCFKMGQLPTVLNCQPNTGNGTTSDCWPSKYLIETYLANKKKTANQKACGFCVWDISP